MLELFHGGLTTTSKKVRLCLKEKGLTYRSRWLNLAEFEHHRSSYLAINPSGLVPTLIDDGAVITESMVINEYLDDRYPTPALRPAGAVDRARMRYWTKLADEIGPVAVVPHVWPKLRAATENLDAGALDNILGAIPLWERRERWRKVAQEGFTAAERDQARAAAMLIAGRMERALADGPWLMGGQFTLADIDLLPFVDLCEKFYPDLFNKGSTPCVDEWLRHMRQRTTVAATYQPTPETCEPNLVCRP